MSSRCLVSHCSLSLQSVSSVLSSAFRCACSGVERKHSHFLLTSNPNMEVSRN